MTKHPASTWTAVAAAIGFTLIALLVALGVTTPLDAAGLRAFAAVRSSTLTSMMLGFTTVGGVLISLPFALALSGWLRVARGGPLASFYVVTCLTGWGMHALLKLLFNRSRPILIPRLSGAGWVSFPSGHAMTSTVIFGLAMVLLTERSRGSGGSRAIIAAGCLLIAGIALSRVYLGVHYPSDVIAGILGGWAWVGGALALLRPRMLPAAGFGA